MLYSSINGIENQHISILDRGLAYGDGIFTTANVIDGQVQWLTQHLARLKDGCELLGISQLDYLQLENEITDAAKLYAEAVLKVIITAGQGGRGYSRDGIFSPNIVITINEFPAHYKEWSETGINVSDSSLSMGINPLLKGIKHLNRLEQVLIRKELDNSSADDLLVTNIFGNIIETSCANVFWLQGNSWFTPNLDNSGVNGLMRQQILNTFSNVQVVNAKLGDIDSIDAMFICNSIMGIVPVKQYNKRKLSVTKVKKIQRSFEGKIRC